MTAIRPASRSNARIVAICLGVVAAMGGLAYASVPLYDLFCRVTGYGGTTQTAEAAPGAVDERTIEIRFDGSRARGLAWDFAPMTRTMTVRLGEVAETRYRAASHASAPVTGTATFNVTPQKVGLYFSKLDCFCFTEQTLTPGQAVEMPVTFFVDPAIADDPNTREVTEITLSYTFFPAPDQPQTGAGGDDDTAALAGATDRQGS